MPETINESLIHRITSKIVSDLHPQKIILFGSRAWGKASKDSDIDIFVIADSSLRRDQRSIRISRLFPDRFFPLDVIVYTPDELEVSIKKGNPFVLEILDKGKVLYAA